MRDIYVLDLHTHTYASGHAYNTMNEMAYAAKEKGLQLLGISLFILIVLCKESYRITIQICYYRDTDSMCM